MRRASSVAWAAELAGNLKGLLDSYGPRRTIDAVTRERLVMTVTAIDGDRWTAWIHHAWQDLLGDRGGEAVDPDDVVLAFAAACADEGRPGDPADLVAEVDEASLGAVLATIAHAELSNRVGLAVDRLLAGLIRPRLRAPWKVAGDLALVGAAFPFAGPGLVLAAGLRIVQHLAPAIPPLQFAGDMDGAGEEPNLLVHVAAKAAPRLLANPFVRTVALSLPAPFVLGLQAGRTQATIRIGAGAVALENGLAPDVDLVVEGEVETLLRAATGDLAAEFSNLHPRRG